MPGVQPGPEVLAVSAWPQPVGDALQLGSNLCIAIKPTSRPWGVEATDGTTRFIVRRDQLLDE